MSNSTKAQKTLVDARFFEEIILKHQEGLTVIENKGWIQLVAAKGRKLYVAKQKRVGAVHISGWETQQGGTVPMEGNGNAKQEMDFARTQDEILETFELLLIEIKTLPPAETLRRQARSSSPDSQAVGWTTLVKKPAASSPPVEVPAPPAGWTSVGA